MKILVPIKRVVDYNVKVRPMPDNSNVDLKSLSETVDFADICITSDIKLIDGKPSAQGFRLDDVPDIEVIFKKADGEKCMRCWKINSQVGKQKHDGCCQRCSDALG